MPPLFVDISSGVELSRQIMYMMLEGKICFRRLVLELSLSFCFEGLKPTRILLLAAQAK